MADKTGFNDVNMVNYSTQNPPTYQANQPQPTVAPAAADTTMNPGTAGVMTSERMGSRPTRTQCVSCRADVVTRIEYKNSTKTHVIALVLCLLGLWPCACIPYCVDSCKSVEHFCPYCNAYIGTYKD